MLQATDLQIAEHDMIFLHQTRTPTHLVHMHAYPSLHHTLKSQKISKLRLPIWHYFSLLGCKHYNVIFNIRPANCWPLHFPHTRGSLPHSGHRRDGTVSSYSIICCLLIVQCVASCLIYCTLFKRRSENRTINFLMGLVCDPHNYSIQVLHTH